MSKQAKVATLVVATAPRATSKAAARQAKYNFIAGGVAGAVAVLLTGLSLTHLSHGIEIVTSAPGWESWLMAIGIDVGFVALEVANMLVGAALRKQIAPYTNKAITGTLAGSAILNAMAFAAPSYATGNYYLMVPAVLLGLAIPALILCTAKVGTTCLLANRT